MSHEGGRRKEPEWALQEPTDGFREVHRGDTGGGNVKNIGLREETAAGIGCGS